MPRFLTKPSSVDFTTRRVSFTVLIVMEAGLGGLLTSCRLNLGNGAAQAVIFILPGLLVAGLLIWRAEHAARRRDTRRTLQLLASFVGRLEQENALRAKAGLAAPMDETPGRHPQPPTAASILAGRSAHGRQDCIIPCSSCCNYLHCAASEQREGGFKTDDLRRSDEERDVRKA
jgi:hypothetical protein